jgi:hypothetical protein
MKLKDKIVVAVFSLLILTWAFPPMNESPRFFYSKYREKPVTFDGFHFIFSNDPYSEIRVLKIDWAKLMILNLVVLSAGGVGYYLVTKKE